MKKQWLDSKTDRTRSWKKYPEFDNLLADCDLPDLEALRCMYKEKVFHYSSSHDIKSGKEREEFWKLFRIYSMVKQEQANRIETFKSSPSMRSLTPNTMSESGLSYDFQSARSYISYNEDEDSFVIYNFDNYGETVSPLYEGFDLEFEMNELGLWIPIIDDKVKESDRKSLYRGWKYYED